VFDFKKLSLKNHFTNNEIRVIFFIIGLGVIGIGVHLFNSLQSSQSKQFEKTNLDSIFTEVFQTDSVQKVIINSYDSLRSSYLKIESKRPKKNELKPESININKASKTELMKLPGIGEITAERIEDYRNNVSKFKSKEELMNVKGIGQKKFEALKKFITIK
jgi:competence protein ComEA